MKRKALLLIVLFMLSSMVCTSASETMVFIDSLEISDYKELWEEENEVNFCSQGINITAEKHYTLIKMRINETYGRDVLIELIIPQEYMSPSVLGNVKSKENISIMWQTFSNETILTFSLLAYQNITIEISKGDLFYGRIKKGVHDFWNYVEYNGDSEGETNVVVFISKGENSFEVSNAHMIVQYRTDFHGWYYPVNDVSSDDVYYYVDVMPDRYRIVTHFNEGESGDVKIHAFSGAESGVLNWDAARGAVSKFVLKVQIGVKKVIMDVFSDNTPVY